MITDDTRQIHAMDALTSQQIRALASSEGGPHLSIYVPPDPPNFQPRQIPAQLKSLLKQAEPADVETIDEDDTARRLLEVAGGLIEEKEAWPPIGHALAAFLGAEDYHCFHLPFSPSPQIRLAPRFAVRPLLGLLDGSAVFYVLAFSRKRVRLLRGARESLDELDIADLPANIDEILPVSTEQKQLQFHTGAGESSVATDRPAVFHGHGASDHDRLRLQAMTEFCRRIDRVITDRFGSRPAPMLILCCVEELAAIYRQVSAYPALVEPMIEGNPDHLRVDQIHRQAWELIRPLLESCHLAAANRYGELAPTPQTTSDVEQVLIAAHDGRVGTLLVSTEDALFGRYDADARRVELHRQRRSGDEDLLDLAVSRTFESSGDVCGYKSEQIPGGNLLAAILRY